MTRTTILSRCYPSSNNHSYASLSRYILNSIPLSTVALTTQRKLSTSRQRVLSSTYDSMIHLSSSVNSGATSRQLRWCSKKRTTSFSIDRSGLLRFDNIWPTNDEILRVSEKKEPPTPLVEQLRNIIKVRGPITVHDYMAQALNNIQFGYYQQNHEKIGSKGDFITSPEISPLFCELIGVWCIATWEAMGSPSQLKLVELGPGKGTLMKEILHVAKAFPKFEKAVTVHMVEVSEAMRKVQQKVFLTSEKTLADSEEPVTHGCTDRGVSVQWHSLLREVPPGQSIFLGHEILDAFPIYQFMKSSGKWKEVLVDVDFTEESPYHFRFVQSGVLTPAVNIFFQKDRSRVSFKALSKFPSVKQQSGETLSSPESVHDEKSPQNQTLMSLDHALYDEQLDSLEISPLAFSLVEEISRNVLTHKSAALLVDYGENYPQGDTLRGFRNHTAVHVLSEPGRVDITADVNFKACAQIAREQGASVQGPVTQGEFLGRMGLLERLHQLAANLSTDEEVTNLIQSTEKVATGSMGKKFKFLAINHPEIISPGFPEK